MNQDDREGRNVTFSSSRSNWGDNIQLAQKWLCEALAAAALQYRFPAESALAQLVDIPGTVQDFTLSQAYSDGSISPKSPWVKDAAMALHAYQEGLVETPKRETLSKARRRSAVSEANYFISSNRVWKKGRPVETDIPLILYLIFVIEGFIGKRFAVSRPSRDLRSTHDGQRPPRGPAFELLLAAYSLASVRHHVMPAEAETVYKTVRTARSDKFRAKLDALRNQDDWYPTSDLSYPELIASRPGVCRLLYSETSQLNR